MPVGLAHGTVSCTEWFALTQANVFQNLGRDLHLFVAFTVAPPMIAQFMPQLPPCISR